MIEIRQVERILTIHFYEVTMEYDSKIMTDDVDVGFVQTHEESLIRVSSLYFAHHKTQ